MTKPTTVAEYVRKCVDDSKLSNQAIAESAGWNKGQIVSMIANGKCLLPANKVSDFAGAVAFNNEHKLEIEKDLSMMVLKEYHPELASSFLKTHFPANNSIEGRLMRAVTDGLKSNPAFKLTEDIMNKVTSIFA